LSHWPSSSVKQPRHVYSRQVLATTDRPPSLVSLSRPPAKYATLWAMQRITRIRLLQMRLLLICLWIGWLKVNVTDEFSSSFRNESKKCWVNFGRMELWLRLMYESDWCEKWKATQLNRKLRTQVLNTCVSPLPYVLTIYQTNKILWQYWSVSGSTKSAVKSKITSWCNKIYL